MAKKTQRRNCDELRYMDICVNKLDKCVDKWDICVDKWDICSTR
jgi:hypothetical protein